METGNEPPIGAVLAGGAASRMGADKAAVPFRGRPMIDLVAASLSAAGCEVVVAGRVRAGTLTAFPDDLGGRLGPAAGLATVLRRFLPRPVALVATDQPLLMAATIENLLNLDGDAVVPIHGGLRQTTCSVYRAPCLEPLLERLGRGHSLSLQTLLEMVDIREVAEDEWAAWGEDGRSFWSLDTPDELAAAEGWDPSSGPPPVRHIRARKRSTPSNLHTEQSGE